jgi:hypothetical protein
LEVDADADADTVLDDAMEEGHWRAHLEREKGPALHVRPDANRGIPVVPRISGRWKAGASEGADQSAEHAHAGLDIGIGEAM